jgi:hypothetical protein
LIFGPSSPLASFRSGQQFNGRDNEENFNFPPFPPCLSRQTTRPIMPAKTSDPTAIASVFRRSLRPASVHKGVAGKPAPAMPSRVGASRLHSEISAASFIEPMHWCLDMTTHIPITT